MYTDFTHQNEFLKDNEQKEFEDIKYENKILSDQVDFDKEFAEKTLDGSKAAIFGGMEGGEDDEEYEEDEYDDDDFEDDEDEEEEEDDDVEGNETAEAGNKNADTAATAIALAERPPQVTTKDNNNPILEKIKKKLGKLEFSLRSTINPEIKDKYFDVGDTEKDMSFVKTKKNISIFVEYKKISTDGEQVMKYQIMQDKWIGKMKQRMRNLKMRNRMRVRILKNPILKSIKTNGKRGS